MLHNLCKWELLTKEIGKIMTKNAHIALTVINCNCTLYIMLWNKELKKDNGPKKSWSIGLLIGQTNNSKFLRKVISIAQTLYLIAFEVHLCTIFDCLDLKPQLFVCFLSFIRNFYSDSDTYSGFYHTQF